jgi:hypothetical protein
MQTNIKANLEVRIKEDQRLKKVAEEALDHYQNETDHKLKKIMQENLEKSLKITMMDTETELLKK